MKTRQLWAYKFLDASGKTPPALLEGVFTSFGDYDQCLAIKSPTINGQHIYGRYCLIRPFLQFNDFHIIENIVKTYLLNNENFNITERDIEKNINLMKFLITINSFTKNAYLFNYGLCIPSQCNKSDVQSALNKLNEIIPIEVGPNKCDAITDTIELNTFQLVIFIILATIVTLVVMSTIIHILYKKFFKVNTLQLITHKTCAMDIIKSFSIITSTNRLVSPLSGRLLIVDLLLIIHILWFIVTLNYAIIPCSGFVGYKNINNSYIINIIKETKYFWLRTYFYRDILFLLCGVIISYDYFGKHQTIPLTVWQYMKFVSEKWLRFIPKIFAPVFVLTIMSVIGNGPGWHVGDIQFVDACPQTYWRNLLFIAFYNNDYSTTCGQMSWLISVLFILNMLSPLFMLPFKLSPKFGYIFNTIALAPASIAIILPKLLFDIKLMPYETADAYILDDMKYSLGRMFMHPDQHFLMFITGIILGYTLRYSQHYRWLKTIFSHRFLRPMSAMVCLSISVLGIAWSENFKDMNEIQNKLNLCIWYVFGKILWSIGNIWFIFDQHFRKNG